MRICFISHLSAEPVEGVRKVALHLAQALRGAHQVELLPVNHASTWRRIRSCRPDVIHFVLSPTSLGILAAWALSLASPTSRTVVSAPHPRDDVFHRWLARIGPEHVLVQARDSERRFRVAGYHPHFFPNGVDVDRFVPVSEGTKRLLRTKYGLMDQFLILHVGPLKAGRNVEVLGQLQKDNRQVLIIGRPCDPGEREVVRELQQRGCKVWFDYMKDIHEIYALSDCYVFPTIDRKHCIETPLSVLEAMASNLPLVTTRFGALPRIIKAVEGVVYLDDFEGMQEAVARFEAGREVINTRSQVMHLSWSNLARRLEGIYDQLS